MAPGPAKGRVAVGKKYGTVGAAELEVPSPRLKKLLVNSLGGAGKAPGSPGTCGIAKTGPAVMVSCLP